MLIGPFPFEIGIWRMRSKWREACDERHDGSGRGYSAEELCVVRTAKSLVTYEAHFDVARQKEAIRLSYAAAKHFLPRLETDRAEVLAAAAVVAAALAMRAARIYESKRHDEIVPGAWEKWLGRSNRYWLMGARFALRAYRAEPGDDLAAFVLRFLACGARNAERMGISRMKERRRTFFLRRYAEHLIEGFVRSPHEFNVADIEAAFVPGDARWRKLLEEKGNRTLLRLLESGADWRSLRAPDGSMLDAEGAARLRLLILGERWNSIWAYGIVSPDRKELYSRVSEEALKEESDDIEKRFASTAERPEAAVLKRKLLDAISRRC